MAVTTTPRAILEAAHGRSMRNNPNSIATMNTELLRLVNRSLQGLYSFAARINPLFFAESYPVPYVAPGWARPQTAESVFRLELLDGTEVDVLPLEDRNANAGLDRPSVYRIGQIYRPTGNSGDPANQTLQFYYSRQPIDAATLDTTLDSLWVERYNSLLIEEVAIYLALKDARSNRGEEIAQLKQERDRWALLFAAFMEHETINERRRFGAMRRFNVESAVPINSILAGGSNLDIAA